jgi:hypothetical protein
MRIAARFSAVICAAMFLSCGNPQQTPTGFINQTQYSDAQLWALWQTAQRNLSQQIDLNPLQRIFQNAPAHIHPGDVRVWNTSPRKLRVAPQADVPSSVLFEVTGTLRPDPTGLVLCPQPCNVHYTTAYSLFRQPAVRYAASWEPIESNFEYLLTYEFENQILNALGYNMKWR